MLKNIAKEDGQIDQRQTDELVTRPEQKKKRNAVSRPEHGSNRQYLSVLDNIFSRVQVQKSIMRKHSQVHPILYSAIGKNFVF